MERALFISVVLFVRASGALQECEKHDRVLLGAFSDSCKLAAIDLCKSPADFLIVPCDSKYCLTNNGIPNLNSCPEYESYADSTVIGPSMNMSAGFAFPWQNGSILVHDQTLKFENETIVLKDFGNVFNVFYLENTQNHRRVKRYTDNSKMWFRLKSGKTPKEPEEARREMPVHLIIIICVVVSVVLLCVLGFCSIGCCYVCRRIFRGSEDRTNSRESRSRSRKLWHNFTALFKKKKKPKSVFSTHSAQPISGVAFDVMPAEPVVAVKGNNNSNPKRYMNNEGNQSLMGTTGDGSSHTSYEEAINQDVEQVDDPLYIPGFKAKGPLAPEHIDAHKFKHRGTLVLKKRQKPNLQHDLANDSYHQPKSTDHIQFDSQMNEVIDFGPGVENIISNKLSSRSCSTAPSVMPNDFTATTPAVTPKMRSMKSIKSTPANSKTPAASSRRKGRRLPPPPPPARAQPMPPDVRPVMPIHQPPQPAHAQPMPKSEMTQPRSGASTAPISEPKMASSSDGVVPKSQKTQQDSMQLS